MDQPNLPADSSPRVDEVLKPILYADIFDYPLTFEEIYKFLEIEVTRQEVKRLLDKAVENHDIVPVNGYYCLAGKAHLVSKRQERQGYSRELWPKATHYGRWIASLPFIRMVAITGSLAVENTRNNVDDVDYFVITKTRRLWLCRAMIILLVKFGHRRGVHLCPNYIMTEKVLFFEEDNLYAAREMLQMVPLYGKDLYLKMRELNAWVTDYLPQGTGLNLDRVDDTLSPLQRTLKKLGEFVLGGPLGDLLERALQEIQITKHTRLAEQLGAADQVLFTADICKGHYDGHGSRTLDAYRQRLDEHRREPKYEFQATNSK